MSASKILSYMFFICWRLVPRTRAGFKLTAEVIQKIPVSSSGSAAVTERKYSRVPPSLVRYSTSCWGSFSAISCPIVALKAACFCIFQDVPITRSSSGSLSCSLLVFHSAFLAFLLACLFCFFPFVSISAPFVFCSVFLVVHYVSWRFLALRGLSWLALAFPGFSWLCLAFLFSCLCFFAGFLVCSVSWPFDIDTRLCKALCPHPGEVVYLTYLVFFTFFFW